MNVKFVTTSSNFYASDVKLYDFEVCEYDKAKFDVGDKSVKICREMAVEIVFCVPSVSYDTSPIFSEPTY